MSRRGTSRTPVTLARQPRPQGRLAATWRRIPLARIAEFGLLGAALFLTRWLSIYVWRLPNGDVTLYYNYALTFLTRAPVLHHLPVEYPPLAVIPFLLTQLPPLPDYQTTYAFWMAALVIAGYVAFLRFEGRARAIVYALYLVLGGAATLLARFDIVPGLVTLGALWATRRGRFGYAYLLIAAGVLLKLYPIFLLPVVAIAQWRAATAGAVLAGRVAPDALDGWWRGGPRAVLRRLWAHPATRRTLAGMGVCLGLVVLGFLAAYALAGDGAFTGFGYAGERPLQIESTPATLLWLGTLVGIPAHADYSFVSLNYVGQLDALLKPLSAVALLGGCAWVYWRQARGQLTPGHAFLACLCAVLVTNKIFSPQYLIWVLPIVAAVEGLDLLWLAVCLLTTLIFPVLYQMRHPILTVPYTPAFMPALAARNLLLLFVTVRAIVRPRTAGRMHEADALGDAENAARAAQTVATPAPVVSAPTDEDGAANAQPALTR